VVLFMIYYKNMATVKKMHCTFSPSGLIFYVYKI
jgi:hypothetical protein